MRSLVNFHKEESGAIAFAFKSTSSNIYWNGGKVNFNDETLIGMCVDDFWGVCIHDSVLDMSVCQDEWELVQLQMLVYRWLNMNRTRMVADTPVINEILGVYRFYKRYDSFRYVGVPFWEMEMCGTGGLFDNFEKGVEYYGYCKGDNLVVEDMYGEMHDMNYWLFEPCTRLAVGMKGISDESMELYDKLGFAKT